MLEIILIAAECSFDWRSSRLPDGTNSGQSLQPTRCCSAQSDVSFALRFISLCLFARCLRSSWQEEPDGCRQEVLHLRLEAAGPRQPRSDSGRFPLLLLLGSMAL